jgi:hypothetical protein
MYPPAAITANVSFGGLIAELQRLRQGLTKCIGCGCLSLSRCQLANRDDRLASRGSGPRYWLGDAPGPAVRSARSAK